MRPGIGIVVPVLNELAVLPACLQQLRDLGADAVILVDGGSSDGSQTLLQASGMRWICSAPGRARQMNAGAAVLENEFLLFLHVDTSIDSSHLEAIAQVMADPEYVGGRFDIRLHGRHPGLGLVGALVNLRSRLSGISTGDQAIFVRRRQFESLGGFADIALMEDVEFSGRLKQCGRMACLRDKISTSGRRWEQNGLVRTVLLMWWLRLRFRLGADPTVLARIYRDVR